MLACFILFGMPTKYCASYKIKKSQQNYGIIIFIGLISHNIILKQWTLPENVAF